MKNIYKFTIVALLASVVLYGCENILEPSVDQSLPIESAVETIDDLSGIILGAHDILNNAVLYGRDIHIGPDVTSDNAFSNTNSNRFVIQAQLNFITQNAYSANTWNQFYRVIALSNIVINNESGLSGAAYDHIVGQAYAIRALSHMNLLKFFGQQWVSGGNPNHGIPYVTTYAEGENFPERDPIAAVWSNIGQDFAQAVNLMSRNQSTSVSLIGYDAVRGLQSRYYLYTGEFDLAIAAADDVINNGGFSLVNAGDLASTWATGGGPGSLWELAFLSTDNPGFDSMARILLPTNYGDVEATLDLYNAYNEDDARRDLFTVTLDGAGNEQVRMTGKYVDELTGTDNIRVIRFAEVWLNKAEALSRRNNGADRSEAQAMINTLSEARGSSRVYTNGEPLTVLAERRLELAMEGHRLFDLARHQLDIPNPPIRPGIGGGNRFNQNVDPVSFGDHRYALPIPNAEMNANPNMVQNTGYGN
jgi:hypothetical protein